MFRFPSKPNALDFLSNAGVKFGTVIDVGTHAETQELRTAFPDHRHLLFEPAEEFFERIRENYKNCNYELLPYAVSDIDGESMLRKASIDGGEVSHSHLDHTYQESGSDILAAHNVSQIKTVRLDTLLSLRSEPEPYFLKIDVDGYEIPIIHGASGIMDKIGAIVVEATADTFAERLNACLSYGFKLIDIIDQCYYSGVFSQADLVFVSEEIYNNHDQLRPWETQDFDWAKWKPLTDYEASAYQHEIATTPPLSDMQLTPMPIRVFDTSIASTFKELAITSRHHSEIAEKARETGLSLKAAAIEACRVNVAQPSVLWHPTDLGFSMRLDLREEIGQRIFLTGTFEPEVLWFLSLVTKPGMNAIDGGAHIGFFTLALASLVGEDGHVDSFEPIASTKATMDENVSISHFSNIATHDKALWSGEEKINIMDYGIHHSAYNSVATPRVLDNAYLPEGVVREVMAVSIDEFVAETGRRPDIIKLDVESAEDHVVQGMINILEKDRPFLVIEVGDFDDTDGVSVERTAVTLQRISKADYRLFDLSSFELTTHKPDPNRIYEYGNIGAVPAEKVEDLMRSM